jgi:hypothetical protein
MEQETLITNYTFNQNQKYLIACTTKGFRYVRLRDGKVSNRSEETHEFEFGLSIACPFF